MTLKKNVYSIKDLENLSGVKAHTIRIWEKRFNILEPMRTESNIRYYDLNNLKKLLNIALLHNHGYKISKISQFPKEKIPELVNGIVSEKNAKSHAISTFKVAIINFDQPLFLQTYEKLLSERSFREIFYDVFIPLLNEIGMLWQTETVTPAHEHFATYLIKQKVIINTERLQSAPPENNDKTFVLFLPENETHETCLLYLNYEVVFNGYRSIYLGANVPMENLLKLNESFENIVFVSYISLQPDKEEITDYIRAISNQLLNDNSNEFWVLGNQVNYVDAEKFDSNVSIVHSLRDFTKKL